MGWGEPPPLWMISLGEVVARSIESSRFARIGTWTWTPGKPGKRSVDTTRVRRWLGWREGVVTFFTVFVWYIFIFFLWLVCLFLQRFLYLLDCICVARCSVVLCRAGWMMTCHVFSTWSQHKMTQNLGTLKCQNPLSSHSLVAPIFLFRILELTCLNLFNLGATKL